MIKIISIFLSAFLLSSCTGVGDYFRSDRYIVQKGDTLTTIAFRYQMDVRNLLKWNHLSPSAKLKPGQKIFVRPPQKNISRYDLPATSVKKVEKKPKVTIKKKKWKAVKKNKSKKLSYKNQYNWSWPTVGKKLLKTHNTILKGLTFSGKKGENIYAVADGTVIYSGNGLKQYGNLVIIKHKGRLLSAYAFNQKNLVKEKDKVKQGQVVAMMGQKDKKAYLYFEIRKNGKPVNPLYYLKPQ